MFLNLRKSYNILDRGRLLQTLEWYRLGPKMRGILVDFWKNQEVVTRQNRYHGPRFRATHSTTQGVLVFPTLSNMEVDSVVHHWISLMVDYG